MTWNYLKIVLFEGFHLSYPLVIEHLGSIYMFAQGSGFSYWKCTSFPNVWVYQKQLHPRPNLNDNSIVFYQEKWWMFSIYEDASSDSTFLHILHAPDLLGPWSDTANNCWKKSVNGQYTIKCVGDTQTPHKSGLLRKHSGIRSGGRPFVQDGKLFRVVQDSINAYGDSMDLYRVVNLTIDAPILQVVVTEFKENFRKPGHIERWNHARYHHVDIHKIHQADGSVSWVALTDGDATNTECHVNTLGVNRHEFWPHERCSDLRAFDKKPTPAPYATADHYLNDSRWSLRNHNISQKLCVVSGCSDDHFDELLPLIFSFQKLYPCQPFYLFDLGLSRERIKFLENLPYVKIFTLLSKRPYVQYYAKAWKPTALMQFMDSYDAHHDCPIFLYGDASVRLKRVFDDAAMNELYKRGLIAEAAMNHPQIEFTHPKMYEFFGIDREKSFLQQSQTKGDLILTQTQSGIILIDATNVTIREKFFRRWANCAENPDCISPDQIPSLPGVQPKQTNFTIFGNPVFRYYLNILQVLKQVLASLFDFCLLFLIGLIETIKVPLPF